MVAVIYAVGVFRIDSCPLTALHSRTLARSALPIQHVVRIGSAPRVAVNERVPAVAKWAAEKVAWCEWWCHSRRRVSFGTAIIVAADP
jgi:hypothetical protein